MRACESVFSRGIRSSRLSTSGISMLRRACDAISSIDGERFVMRLWNPQIGLVVMLLGAGIPGCLAQVASSTVPGSSTTPPVTSPTESGPTSADASQQAQKSTDDANKVEAAAAAATRLLDDADKYQKTIAGITIPAAKRAQPALDDLQQLQTIVEAVNRSKLIAALTDSKAALASAENTRNQDCSGLSQPSSGPQQDVTDALAKRANAGKDASAAGRADRCTGRSASQAPDYFRPMSAIMSRRSKTGSNHFRIPN